MNAKSGDTGYAGILVLDDGTFIMDSYGHFDEEFSKNAFESSNYNREQFYVISNRQNSNLVKSRMKTI